MAMSLGDRLPFSSESRRTYKFLTNEILLRHFSYQLCILNTRLSPIEEAFACL